MKNCTYSYIATILIISSTALLPGAYAGESPPTAVRSIAWSECPADWFPEAASQDVVCGTLDVPMQRYGNQRSRESVRLALSKLPATGEAKGSVILVAGWPRPVRPGLFFGPIRCNDAVACELRYHRVRSTRHWSLRAENRLQYQAGRAQLFAAIDGSVSDVHGQSLPGRAFDARRSG